MKRARHVLPLRHLTLRGGDCTSEKRPPLGGPLTGMVCSATDGGESGVRGMTQELNYIDKCDINRM